MRMKESLVQLKGRVQLFINEPKDEDVLFIKNLSDTIRESSVKFAKSLVQISSSMTMIHDPENV